MTNLNIVLGRAFWAVTRSAKLRAALAAVVVAAFARLGMNLDDESAVALLLLAGTLAGWGPTGEKAT